MTTKFKPEFKRENGNIELWKVNKTVKEADAPPTEEIYSDCEKQYDKTENVTEGNERVSRTYKVYEKKLFVFEIERLKAKGSMIERIVIEAKNQGTLGVSLTDTVIGRHTKIFVKGETMIENK